MPSFIDRRLNPKDKSLSNRQRFLRRARGELKRVVHEKIKSGKIVDVDAGHRVPFPLDGTSEPSFQPDRSTGRREHVLPGNKEFISGDRLAKPGQGGGTGAGKGAAAEGDMEDDFQFVLSREEVLDLFFEDLELPDMVKSSLKEAVTFRSRRAGFTIAGSPTNINVGRTMRNSFGRRIALQRPKLSQVEALAKDIEELEAKHPKAGSASFDRLAKMRSEMERLERRRKVVGYIDPVDIRFNRFEPQPLPNASAVMFCLMDVSGSMGEREKDLAKRFFVLLHLFLKRRYERIDIVFIRHTHQAHEVDEETFFRSTQSGGTVVSTALEEMQRIILERYPSRDWNIYAAQASDGDNLAGDSEHCVNLLNKDIMKLCQYYAYVEILDERESAIFRSTDNGTSLWRSYRQVGENWRNFQMTRIAKPGDIYPVFRQLFAKQPSSAKNG
ncbi:MAG: YeaH/YhbH family protein [Phyllobacterium sp.]|uniref:YeaH/YhbH family protein n=1 Tax=Phyllobacterium sp. TaxID=1871046 RepID=UPI0030F179F6